MIGIMIEIALYQPDIAPNAATIIRMCACFALKVTIIEPAGFAWTDSSFRRAGMDYLDLAKLERAPSWAEFTANLRAEQRLVLLTTKAAVAHIDFKFQAGDVLLLGRESAGVPEDVHHAVHHRIKIPMATKARSLNIAIATGIVTGEALRQLTAYPPAEPI
jgi:tRNA (cytidine/uridine-2'-O-)-methyltransferase